MDSLKGIKSTDENHVKSSGDYLKQCEEAKEYFRHQNALHDEVFFSGQYRGWLHGKHWAALDYEILQEERIKHLVRGMPKNKSDLPTIEATVKIPTPPQPKPIKPQYHENLIGEQSTKWRQKPQNSGGLQCISREDRINGISRKKPFFHHEKTQPYSKPLVQQATCHGSHQQNSTKLQHPAWTRNVNWKQQVAPKPSNKKAHIAHKSPMPIDHAGFEKIISPQKIHQGNGWPIDVATVTSPSFVHDRLAVSNPSTPS
jgi:hypothetical protein